VFFPVRFLTSTATILDRFASRTLFEIDIVHIIFGEEAIGAGISFSFIVRFAFARAIRSCLQTINAFPTTMTTACNERPAFAVGTEILVAKHACVVVRFTFRTWKNEKKKGKLIFLGDSLKEKRASIPSN
jgi:hypothetical protein